MAAIAALALIPLGACSGNQGKAQGAKVEDKEDVYTGVLPAADAEGIRYTLKLDYDDDDSNMSGDYKLVETYLVSDSTAKIQHRDSVSFKTEGDFYVESGTGNGVSVKYLKLVPDKKFSNGETLYFLIDSDSTLTLTNSELQVSQNPGLNYTLNLVK